MKRLGHGRARPGTANPPGDSKALTVYIGRKTLSKAQAMAPRVGFLYFTDLVQTLITLWSDGKVPKALRERLLEKAFPESRAAWVNLPTVERTRVTLKIRLDIFTKGAHRAEAFGLSGTPELARILLDCYVNGEIEIGLRPGPASAVLREEEP